MRWIVVLLLALVGVWMLFDGGRALLVGDYITPSRGTHAGELGPWSRIVAAAGIPPRSTVMKIIFLAVGALHIVAAVSLAFDGAGFAPWLALAAAAGGLWYLPFGTMADGIALVIIATGTLRPW